MRLLFVPLIIIGLQVALHSEVTALSQSDIYLSSHIIPQGDIGIIKIKVTTGETPRVSWMDRKISLIPTPDKTYWFGLLAADLTKIPGHYEALIKISPSGDERRLEIEIIDKDYGERRLTLPRHMVDLDAKTLKRVQKESGKMERLWEAQASTPLWGGPFQRPIPGEAIGPFGRRSIINDQPRSPHSGLDLRGAEGTPIKAINNGKVVLTGDHFFTGRTVVLDHGGEIQSMYFHLDKIQVEHGDLIEKGQLIGLVGSTGRATGPHLHWGIRINGARVDPLKLISLTKELEGKWPKKSLKTP
jgi:hypothetical protein